MHAREGKFVFLPETLVLVFKRFSYINHIESKKHSKVDLQKKIVITGNAPCHYVLKACALHHGAHIHNGHYTALIFDDDQVIEVDDERAHDVAKYWKTRADTTVYLAFYTLMNSCQESDVLFGNNQEDFNNKEAGKQQNNGSSIMREIKEKDDDNEKRELFEIECLWDVTEQNSLLCSASKFGYELKGKDFKTLELPVLNNSYTVERPGWLNDNIVDAYISLLVKAATSHKGIRAHAFNCFFMKKLRETLLKKRCQINLYEMLSKFHKKVVFEALEYIIIPINTNNGKHWTVIFIDIWMGCIYFYDPMLAGIQNETDVKLIKFYFEQYFKCNSYEVKIQDKRFVRDFDVIWEDQFACQRDYASCGVYILMYVSQKMGLLNRDPLKDKVSEIRKEFASELYRGRKFLPAGGLKGSDKVEKKCLTASRYKQHLGERVVLHCYSPNGSDNEFVWSFQGTAMSSDQTYEFILATDKVGEYVCYANYGQGVVLKSQCIVECAAIQSEKVVDHTEIINSLKVAIEWNFPKK